MIKKENDDLDTEISLADRARAERKLAARKGIDDAKALADGRRAIRKKADFDSQRFGSVSAAESFNRAVDARQAVTDRAAASKKQLADDFSKLA
ncbi:MAG TPA: hypothetical protein VN934_06100 [Candidatus Tumulicola sp.]|nr:hypothetical protein [Candidatus Tumulicola sp.]